MQTVKASEFKAKCLALMDEVARTSKPVVVTKNGNPVAELRPYVGKRPKSPIGMHRGLIRIKGDIVSPLDVEWEALKFQRLSRSPTSAPAMSGPRPRCS